MVAGCCVCVRAHRWPPLLLATRRGFTECVEVLLAHQTAHPATARASAGAALEIVQTRAVPLAAAFGHVETVRVRVSPRLVFGSGSPRGLKGVGCMENVSIAMVALTVDGPACLGECTIRYWSNSCASTTCRCRPSSPFSSPASPFSGLCTRTKQKLAMGPGVSNRVADAAYGVRMRLRRPIVSLIGTPILESTEDLETLLTALPNPTRRQTIACVYALWAYCEAVRALERNVSQSGCVCTACAALTGVAGVRVSRWNSIKATF